MRTKDFHDTLVREQTKDNEDDYGVKQSCVLSDHLSYFHPITGFPPDILHDLFEGVVPVELARCLKGLSAKKYFTLEELNNAIWEGTGMRTTLCLDCYLFSLAPECQKGRKYGKY